MPWRMVLSVPSVAATGTEISTMSEPDTASNADSDSVSSPTDFPKKVRAAHLYGGSRIAVVDRADDRGDAQRQHAASGELAAVHAAKAGAAPTWPAVAASRSSRAGIASADISLVAYLYYPAEEFGFFPKLGIRMAVPLQCVEPALETLLEKRHRFRNFGIVREPAGFDDFVSRDATQGAVNRPNKVR